VVTALLALDVLLAATLAFAAVDLRTRQRRAEQWAYRAVRREYSSRPHSRAAGLNARWTGTVRALRRARDGTLATRVTSQASLTSAPPLVLEERTESMDRSLVAVGPGRSSPTAGGLGSVWQSDLTESPDGRPRESPPDDMIRQIRAQDADQNMLASADPEWGATNRDERDLVESLARGVGRNITPDGYEWLIRRRHPGVAAAATSLAPPTPTGPGPDRHLPDSSSSPTLPSSGH
jgi:hypothetical protein